MANPVSKAQVWATGLRILLLIVNVIVLLLCLGVFVTGLWVRLSEKRSLEITEYPALTRTSVSVAVVGLCAVLLSLLGIVGALLVKSLLGRIVLTVYAFVLVFIIATEIATGVAAIRSRSERTKKMIANSTFESLKHHYDNKNDSQVWDNFQRTYECCGASNYTDYEKVFNDSVVPTSCCNQQAILDGKCKDKFVPAIEADIFTRPCVEQIYHVLWRKMLVLAIVPIVIGVSQSIGAIVSAIMLFIAARDQEKAFSYKKLKLRRRSSRYSNS